MPQEDSKLVKKEEVDGEDDEKCIASAFAKKKSPSSSNTALKSEAKVKKEVKMVRKEEIDEDFKNHISVKASNKPDKKEEIKKKTKKEKAEKKKGAKAGDTDKDTKKRGKKEFALPGQKRDPPEERDPLRIFYATLYKQVPISEMASIWMMESGLLPREEAKVVFERKHKVTQEQKLRSPAKTVVTVKKKAESVTTVMKSTSSPVTVVKKSTTSPISMQRKETSGSKFQSNKGKSKDDSSKDDTDDDDFVMGIKKRRNR